MENLVGVNLDIKIDFELLKNQKRDLINLIEFLNNEEKKVIKLLGTNYNTNLVDNLEGILNIITEIQDYAVDELGFDENKIFDLE